MLLRSVLLTLALVLSLFVKALGLWLTPHPEYCSHQNGSVTAQVWGGTPPYTYLWSNNAITESITGLSAGTYSLTVTDFLGEQVIQEATVISTTYGTLDLTFDYSLGRAYCLDSTGAPMQHVVVGHSMIENAAQVTMSNPLGLAWTVPVDNDGWPGYDSYLVFASGTPGTTYSVLFSDDSNCPGTIVVTIGYEAEFPQLTVLDVQGACSNGANGSILVGSGLEGHGQWLYLHLFNADHEEVALHSIGGTAMVTEFNALLPGDYWLVQSILSVDEPFYDPIYRAACGDSMMVTVPDLGGSCGNVSGTVFMDYDEDCIQNGSLAFVPGAVITFDPGPFYATTNTLGQYSINLPTGNYTETQGTADIVQHCPAPPASVNVNGNQVLNIADTSLVPLDVAVSIANGPARPGFELNYALQLLNNTPSSSGSTSTVMTFDPTVSFVSAIPTPSTVNGNTITWNQSAMVAFQQRSIQVRLQVPSDPGLIGTVLNASVSVSTANIDADPSDNSVSTSVTITGSYDPNEKVAATSTRYSDLLYYIDTDQWIDYTLRFQNTGTDTAFNIIVTDTLPVVLDPATIEWGSSSHTCLRSVVGQGVVKFIFPNILLPDSNVNEAASHGFASFRIRPRAGLLPGTMISNVANIFFDYNPPVITEPSVLIAEQSTGVHEREAGALALFPNPAQNAIWLKAPSEMRSVEVYAVDGRLMFVEQVRNEQVQLAIASLPAGSYSALVRLENGMVLRDRFLKY